MGKLSNAVKPARGNSKDILDGPVELRAEPVFNDWEAHKTASKHWRRNIVLQTLAIRAYLEELQSQDIVMDERSLKRDLQELSKWEKTQPEANRWINVYGGANLPYQDHSQGWKQAWKQRKKRE
jgi:hypothetical protein